MAIFTLREKLTFKIKLKNNNFFSLQRLWKLFDLLLATHLCEVCVQCLLVLYASVHEVCANTCIYNANTPKFKYLFILEFFCCS